MLHVAQKTELLYEYYTAAAAHFSYSNDNSHIIILLDVTGCLSERRVIKAFL